VPSCNKITLKERHTNNPRLVKISVDRKIENSENKLSRLEIGLKFVQYFNIEME